jgi:hypothetical protein
VFFSNFNRLRGERGAKIPAEGLREFERNLETPAALPPKFGPMQALLDDGEILAIHPSHECFGRLRRAHRRIYLMYVAEFRRDVRAVVRARLTDVNARAAWPELGSAIGLACKLTTICGGFYLVWCAHGLRFGNGRRAVRRLLEIHQSTVGPLHIDLAPVTTET